MEMTRDELLTALRRVGVVGTVSAGMFDNLLTPNTSADYGAVIAELQEKDATHDTLILEVDQRVSTLENIPAGTDYSGQITAVEQKNTTQDTRITANEAALLSKAGLVNGKVPYEQLPEFPVGRKVNVANKAARLALPAYADLTIAYESDTADAWGLDANDDPAIDANWSKLGNTQGVGVASFNGRTGNIGPMAGDYNTGQVTEVVDKRFVTEAQMTEWNAKETTTGAQTKATTAQTAATSAAKTYADSTFIPLSQKAASNGVAPLDTGSRVPIANLPTFLPQSKRTWKNVLGVRTLNAWYISPTNNEMDVHVRSTGSTDTGRFLEIQMRESPDLPTVYTFRSAAGTYAGSRWLQIAVTVPAGWQYALSASGGTTSALTETWYELS